ncbi:MAG: pseudouridine synthase, partial [Prolixibacteraceae bacterium]|nr:pseudouridine synthase [Prolixibacteraceae bacterium]
MNKPIRKKGSSARKDALLEIKKETELMKFLIEALPHKSRQNIKTLLSKKQIEVNGSITSQFNFLLHPGDELKIKGERAAEVVNLSGFSIIFEDEYLIVIDKHAGILSMGNESEKKHTAYNFLSQHVKRSDPSNKIFIVHRLDRETSGLMVFAKSAEV